MMFKKDYWKKHSTLEQLATLLTEIEAVLNSWPLTYVYEDFRSGFVLTPHFLVTNRKFGLCTIEDIEYHEDENRDSVKNLLRVGKRPKTSRLILEILEREYLMSLRERLPLIHKAHDLSLKRT